MVPDRPNASGGPVDRAREVERASPAAGVERVLVAGLFIPIEPDEADLVAAARELPSGPDVGPEPSPRSATSDVSDLAEGAAPAPGDTFDAVGPGGRDPGSTILTVLLPDVHIPLIEVPSGDELHVPIVGTISTPRFAASEGWVRLPDLTVSASHDTVDVGAGDSAVVTPEFEFSEAGVGSAGTTTDEGAVAWAVTDEETRTVQPTSSGELLGLAVGSLLRTL
jgi:hypothetical protein